MITQQINLNLIPGGVLPRIKVSQYDKGSRVLQFNLFNGSSAFTIPVDASITIQGTKADHTGFQYACTFSGSTVTADLEQQMTVFAGPVECEIRIAQDDGDVLLGTCNFILDVEEAALQDDIIISETELPLVEKAAEAADAAEASALDAEAWAVGQRDGEDVPADDPAYHNNSKYYAETVPTLLTNYYTKSETYSKGEVDTALSGKQNTLTFDDTPTSASSNPVKSGGVYTALSGKVDTEAGKGLSKNDFTDAEKAKTDNAVLWSERKEYVGKNLLKNNATTSTYFTVNSDGTIDLSGTTTTAQIKDLNSFTGAELKAKGDKLFLSGGDAKAYVALRTSSWTFIARTYGDDVLFDTSELDNATTYYCTVGIQANTDVDGVKVKPMIRLASIADSTYEPYLPSNNNLYERIVLKKGMSITENSNPIYAAALFQTNKQLRLFLPLNRRIEGSSVNFTLNNLQLFRGGNYEEITTGLSVSANVLNDTGLYLIITSENAFTTFSSLDIVMARLFNYTITVN